ncbi:MAG: hypothetical protein Q4B70_03455 [Lachnospiraceae bacterium]|nr:hypothetical protein [Lachnospiraceae bacterium]
MKITKVEKIWLLIVVVLYVIYNIPGFPKYGDSFMCLVSGLILVGGIWVVIYIGMSKVYKIQKLKEEEEED